MIPLAFLSNSIFCELFKMSEEEFGLPSDGPITLPCDSVVMNYIVSLMERGLDKDLERAVLNSITSYRCSSDAYFNQGHATVTSLWILSELTLNLVNNSGIRKDNKEKNIYIYISF